MFNFKNYENICFCYVSAYIIFFILLFDQKYPKTCVTFMAPLWWVFPILALGLLNQWLILLGNGNNHPEMKTTSQFQGCQLQSA